MRIRIHRSCALALISVLCLFASAAAQEDLQGQPFNQFSHSSQLRAKTGKTRKVNAANKPAHYTYEVLYNFAGGSQVASGLIQDAAGNLYGVIHSGGITNYGAVFEVDAAGNETVLYNFCSQPKCADGAGPNGLVMDSAGNLYGTAIEGGAYSVPFYPGYPAGVVFELAPPAQPGGAWTETVLYNFCSAGNCSDGWGPFSGVIQDAAGNIYGTTDFGGVGNADNENSYGTVFELSPPSQSGGTWTETVLHAFCAAGGRCEDGSIPSGDLIQDAAGNLYGTTQGGGTGSSVNGINGVVFQLSPPPQPGGPWTETVLYDFCSLANCADGGEPEGVIMDSAGNLYGATYNGGLYYFPNSNVGGGTVFELAPPAQSGGAWTETMLYSFCSLANCADGQYPSAAPTQDAAGNLYGTTVQGGANQTGTAFELSPPAQPGGAWTETVLYSFCSDGGTNCTDGGQSKAGLLRDPVGNLYGTTFAGGSHGGGTVFTLAVPSFTLAGTAVSLDPGATTGNTSTITLSPLAGFTGKVTLTAAITSKPAGAQELPTLSFGSSSPVSITGASAVKATLTITTTAPTSATLELPRDHVSIGTLAASLAFGLIFGIGICIPTRGRTRRTRLGSLLFLVILAPGLLSCGGGTGSGNSGSSTPGTTPGTYVVTVTGTSGSITATGTVALTVQ